MHHVLRSATNLALTLVLAFGTAMPGAQAAQTTRYVYVYVNDNIPEPGRQVVERADDGLVTVSFIYKNNGRGPELTERFRLAADGTFSEYHVTGSSTFGAKVDEHYERKGDAAEWRSTSERGQAVVAGAAQYVPLNSSLAPLSVAIAALGERGEAGLPLLPSGVLRQRKLAQAEVERGAERQQVQLLALTGIGLRPTLVWATMGNPARLFALADLHGEVLIEDGWQANRKTLEAQQASAERALLLDLAQRLRHPLPGLTVIRNARIFDSATARLGNAADVYVLRGRITAILPAGSPARDAEQEIDAAGRVMLPGLFDMHGHTDAWDGFLNLASGVTTVRDMGNDNAAMQRLLDDREAGAVLSPRIIACGFLEGVSPFSSSFGFTVSTLAQAREAIDWYAQRGYPQLKIYNSFPKAIVRETVAYAHSLGMRVSGHVPAFMRAQEVVEQGFDEIQHINQVMLNFLVTPTTDTRTLQRFILPAKRMADFDLDAAPVQAFVALLKQHKTVVDPTLAAFDFIRQVDGELSAPYAAIADHMPPDLQRYFRVGSMNIPDAATAARYARSYDKMVAFVGRLYRAGIPLVAGTDALAGFTLQGELALYVKAGLTPAQALQVATRNGATYSRTADNSGSVAVGKRADLVLFDGDPSKNIADVYRVALVVTQGHWLAPKELHEAFGVRPFVDQTPTLRTKPPASELPARAAGAPHGSATPAHLH